MNHCALNPMPSAAERATSASFGRRPLAWRPRGPASDPAGAGRVLDEVLNACGGAPQAMRAGSRVTPLRDERFDAAVRLYRDGHWALAFDCLASMADQGHAPAAKLALLMTRYGASLYGVAFAVPPSQIARWAQRALRAISRPTASPSSITASA